MGAVDQALHLWVAERADNVTKEHTKLQNKDWQGKVAAEIMAGSAWVHRFTKEPEAAPYKPGAVFCPSGHPCG